MCGPASSLQGLLLSVPFSCPYYLPLCITKKKKKSTRTCCKLHFYTVICGAGWLFKRVWTWLVRGLITCPSAPETENQLPCELQSLWMVTGKGSWLAKCPQCSFEWEAAWSLLFQTMTHQQWWSVLRNQRGKISFYVQPRILFFH